MSDEPTYPPDTYPLLSWSAIQFIHRPARRILAYACFGILGILILGIWCAAVFPVDVREKFHGELTSLQTAAGVQFEVRLNAEPGELLDIVPGQTAYHQLAAYPVQRFGIFDGRVLEIRAEKSGPHAGRSAVITSLVLPHHLNPDLLKRIWLAQGMKVDTQIVTARKTALRMVLDKFLGKM